MTLFAKNYKYYTTKFTEISPLPKINNDTLNEIQVSITRDVTYNTRAIYTILDLLGDIGGLADMCTLIARLLLYFISFIFGSELD